MSGGVEIDDRDIIAGAVLEEFLVPYQGGGGSDEQLSVPVSEICDEIPDYPDDEIKDVIDELAAESTGVDYDNGSLRLTDKSRAENYYSMCSPFG